jgi:hypothetical protein
MTPASPLNLDRNYPALFLALDEVLEVLDQGGPDEDTLRRSFESLADGFGVEKAVMLVVENRQPLRFRAVGSRGLSTREIAACERGWSVPGVSSTRIREAVLRGVPVVVYAQNHGVRSAFGEIDRAWIELYARALGRLLRTIDRPARAKASR